MEVEVLTSTNGGNLNGNVRFKRRICVRFDIWQIAASNHSRTQFSLNKLQLLVIFHVRSSADSKFNSDNMLYNINNTTYCYINFWHVTR